MEAITTIQIRKSVKRELDKLKSRKESYEDLILSLVNVLEKQRRQQSKLLVEGYKETAEESKRVSKEWSSTNINWD
jgi:predicted CopG family antitoxin